MDKEIENKVRNIIATNVVLETSSEEIKSEDDLTKIGMDSLSVIKVIVEIEAEYNFEFLDEDLLIDNFKNIKSLVSYIEKRINLV